MLQCPAPAGPALRACSQPIAESDPAELSSRSHSEANYWSRTWCQNHRFATVLSGQVIFVAKDHVTSTPLVAFTNSERPVALQTVCLPTDDRQPLAFQQRPQQAAVHQPVDGVAVFFTRRIQVSSVELFLWYLTGMRVLGMPSMLARRWAWRRLVVS